MTNADLVVRARRIFVAGSTGATGRTVLRLAGADSPLFRAHRRPKDASDVARNDNEFVFPLTDKDRLSKTLRECTTVVQLIGTTRQRFSTGDTYEASDIGTTRYLTEAAQASGIDHFILLSSVGAGRPIGAYLKAKAAAERLVMVSQLPYTIIRPSAFMGEGHHVPGFADVLTRFLRMDSYRPIAIEDLALVIIEAAVRRSDLGAMLEGMALWKSVDVARSHRPPPK